MIGLPSLQAMDRAQETRIWLASEAMDMRCGFDQHCADRVSGGTEAVARQKDCRSVSIRQPVVRSPLTEDELRSVEQLHTER